MRIKVILSLSNETSIEQTSLQKKKKIKKQNLNYSVRQYSFSIKKNTHTKFLVSWGLRPRVSRS